MARIYYHVAFHVDHVIARQHGGQTELENLAFSCFRCNAHKGPNIAGIDPVTEELSRLYHPRRDRWHDHFEWHGPELFGFTPVGRVTVRVLAINDPSFLAVRAALIAEGIFP